MLLLLGGAKNSQAQALDLSKSVVNITTAGDGSSASQNQVLEYTIVARNLGSSSITNATLYDHIPAGTSYVAGSATLNGTAVADVSGSMPYAGAGGLIRSPSGSPGVLSPNAAATVTFRVRVTANGGTVTNYATLEGMYNGGAIAQNTNTVFTSLSPDGSCSVLYQSTASTQGGSTFRYIRTVNAANGTAGPILYNGATGPCYNAVTGAVLSAGSVLVNSAAIAYDKNSGRIYFVNNNSSSVQDLCYIDLNASPVAARRFVGYPLETTTGSGWNVNRMAFASDGYGYAITSNAQDIIRFSINPATGLPVISRLGPLINDSNNGVNDILSEGGGDIFGDGSGNLYLIANSSRLYKINPNTRVTTFLGSVNPFPGTSNSIAIDAAGSVYIGGSYQNVYTVNLATMAATSVTGGSTTNVWANGDYTSCALPVLAPALNAGKSYHNINGNPFVVLGDTIEYTITVTNTGNINAAGVRLYDSIPGATDYIPGSTTLNGMTVPDVSGTMPFAVPGGRYIYSTGEENGIIKPGTANRAIVTFRVKVSPLQYICNQSRITLVDGDGNSIFINSDDSTQAGSQNPTCFFSDGVLPLQDLEFTGRLLNDRSFLQWSASNETNLVYFEVEYSGNGRDFTSLARLENENSKLHHFTDEVHRLQGSRFYRLKIVRTGGGISYSRTIRLDAGGTKIRVQPNPFLREISIHLPLNTAATVKVRITDLQGRPVTALTKNLTAGIHDINIAMPTSVSPGIYLLEIMSGPERILQKKLVKVN